MKKGNNVCILHIADSESEKLDKRRLELIADLNRCDADISTLRARRSDAVIDDRQAEADGFETQLAESLQKRVRIEEGIARIGERIREAHAERRSRERQKHNGEVAQRLDALDAKCCSFLTAARQLGELGKAIIDDAEGINRLGMHYLTFEDAVLHRLLPALQRAVAVNVDMPLRRDIPIELTSEAGRDEYWRVHAPERVLAEARLKYLMPSPTPPEAA